MVLKKDDTTEEKPREEWEIARGGTFLQIWNAGTYNGVKVDYLTLDKGRVADVELPNVMDSDMTHNDAIEQMMPRAHLIKAAPGLLYACEEALNEMRAWQGEEENNTDSPMFYIFDLLKTHIANAKGVSKDAI